MGAGYLADGNAIIDLALNRLPPDSAIWPDEQSAAQRVTLSVIARIGLLTKTRPAAEYVAMQASVQSVEVLPLDEFVVQQTILLRQQHRVKLPDAIIGATALVHGLTLITRNTADFKAVSGLKVPDPHNSTQLSGF